VVLYCSNWNEAVRSYPKLNDVPLGPKKLNGAIVVCRELIQSVGIYPNFSNLWKHFKLHPNLNKTLLIHPDISKRSKILMELFYIARL